MKPILPLFTLSTLCTQLLFSQNSLDNAGLSAVAFSLRKLSSNYAGATIRIVNSGGLYTLNGKTTAQFSAAMTSFLETSAVNKWHAGYPFPEIIAPDGNKQTRTMRIY